MTNEQSIKKLQQEIATFIEERDWAKFHSPKNLAMALTVETAELLEIFQWLTEDESKTPSLETHRHIEEEIGDILIYLFNLAGKFNINPVFAALNKMEMNRQKYPVARARGKADKYTAYEERDSSSPSGS